jgi:DTW domain-containing protein YfiP
MFDTEPMKPSNTGRLIADILPDTAAFQWSRTEPPQALLDLVASPDYQPMVVFPASYAGESVRCFPRRHPVNRRCLLCWTAPGPKREKCSAKALILTRCR